MNLVHMSHKRMSCQLIHFLYYSQKILSRKVIFFSHLEDMSSTFTNTVSTLRNLKAMRCCSFMNLSTTIMMFIYSLLFDRSIMKLIEILCYYHIEIDIDCSTSCFCL